MPFILHIPLQTEERWSPKWPDHQGMHAILLQALANASETLAAQVHDAQVNPFTQALHRPATSDDNQPQPMRWRITLLDDSLYEPLMAGLYALGNLHVQDRPFTLQLSALESRHQTYDALAAAPVQTHYRFAFYTATTFHQRTHHTPIPTPYLCYQSWWTRWQAFAPARLGINITVQDIAQEHMVISHFRIRSRGLASGRTRLVGAVGQMTFHTLRTEQLAPHWWQHIAALAAFSAFCGTGHKTAQGLGQTRPLPPLIRRSAGDTP